MNRLSYVPNTEKVFKRPLLNVEVEKLPENFLSLSLSYLSGSITKEEYREYLLSLPRDVLLRLLERTNNEMSSQIISILMNDLLSILTPHYEIKRMFPNHGLGTLFANVDKDLLDYYLSNIPEEEFFYLTQYLNIVREEAIRIAAEKDMFPDDLNQYYESRYDSELPESMKHYSKFWKPYFNLNNISRWDTTSLYEKLKEQDSNFTLPIYDELVKRIHEDESILYNLSFQTGKFGNRNEDFKYLKLDYVIEKMLEEDEDLLIDQISFTVKNKSAYFTVYVLETIKLFRKWNIFNDNYYYLLELLNEKIIKKNLYYGYLLPEIVYSLVKMGNLEELIYYNWDILSSNEIEKALDILALSLHYVDVEDMIEYFIDMVDDDEEPLLILRRVLDQV